MAHRKRQPRKFSSVTFSDIVSDLPEKMEFVTKSGSKEEKVKTQVCCECDAPLVHVKVCSECGLVQYYRKFRYVKGDKDESKREKHYSFF